MAKELNRYFSKENNTNSNMYNKKGSTSLIIREVKSKTTMRYDFIPVK
jgi:hypothetical protein